MQARQVDQQAVLIIYPVIFLLTKSKLVNILHEVNKIRYLCCMESKNNHQEDHSLCPRVQAAFEMLGKKWTGLILHELTGGERCFMALERAVPSLSSRMLALRMKELEALDLVARQVEPGPPLRVIYRLAPKGRALEPVMRGLAGWAREWN